MDRSTRILHQERDQEQEKILLEERMDQGYSDIDHRTSTQQDYKLKRSNSCISGTLRSRSREENQNHYRTWSHSQRSIPELYSRTVTSSLPGGTYRTLERDRICGSVRKIAPIRRSCGNLPVQTNIYHICNL
ncbi:uncharacterized protein LOC111696919 [Eurytemora carolleeae]|uniref:uncharacterized protein LOC111696919 n=1 Tax=Eurytemora carolleeae TaxID=1294199 RepID=UPI000C77C341|nr:uncharacterized protein LOC111696919 [Eurytemora carolleeae]|eukprot:XP_023322476.1 uncharacterized protein LOC111696919 [Eurytemora affinis]